MTPFRSMRVASVEVQWCVFHGGTAPDEAAGYQVFDGGDEGASESDAREARQWLIESGVARRTVHYGPWEVMPNDRWASGEPDERGES